MNKTSSRGGSIYLIPSNHLGYVLNYLFRLEVEIRLTLEPDLIHRNQLGS